MKYILDRKKKLDNEQKEIRSKIENLEKEFKNVNKEKVDLRIELIESIYTVMNALLKKHDIKKKEGENYIAISNKLPDLFNNIHSIKLEEGDEGWYIEHIDLVFSDDVEDDYDITVVDSFYGETISLHSLTIESIYNILEYLLSKINSKALKNLNN